MMNRIGQIRIYSAVDLMGLLLAAHASSCQVGVSLCLWFGFLLYLESCHKHDYRQNFPKLLWSVLWVVAIVALPTPEYVAFILFSWLYAKKTRRCLGLWSPVFRGLQSLMIVAGIVGYTNTLPWLAFMLVAIRNVLGDVRDADKDRAEGMTTIPIVLGWGSVPNIHLIGVLATSLVWFSLTHLSWAWLPAVWTVEIFTYNWTPRKTIAH